MTTIPPMPNREDYMRYEMTGATGTGYLDIGRYRAALEVWGITVLAKVQELEAALAEQSEALEGCRETSADRIEQVAELKAKLEEAERIIAAYRKGNYQHRLEWTDCRNAGPFYEMGGSYCPIDKPCDRCGWEQTERKLEAQAGALAEALEELLNGLGATTWSSWQTTARFSKEQQAAQGVLTTYREGR